MEYLWVMCKYVFQEIDLISRELKIQTEDAVSNFLVISKDSFESNDWLCKKFEFSISYKKKKKIRISFLWQQHEKEE